MRQLIAAVAVAAGIAAAPAGAAPEANGAAARPPRALPFRVMARGTNPPPCCEFGHHWAVPPPDVALRRAGRFLDVTVLAGGFPAPGYTVDVERVTVLRFQGKRQLRIDARLTLPPVPFGSPAPLEPYEVVRVRRAAIDGRVPKRAFLVETQTDFEPHLSFSRVARTFADAAQGAARVRAALAVSNFLPLGLLFGGGQTAGGGVWYVRGDGEFHWANGAVTPHGFFVIDDLSGLILGGGYR